MPLNTHLDMLKCAVSGTPGTGTITVSTASSGFRTFGAADDGKYFSCTFNDGTDWETADQCLYTHSGTTLTRGTFVASSTGSALSLTSAAIVTVGPISALGNGVEKLLKPGPVKMQGTGTNQTISSTSTFTKVTCMQVEYDENSYWNNTNKVIQPTQAGRYLLVFAGLMSGIDDTKRIIFRIGVDETGGGTLDSSNAQSFDLLRAYSPVASGFVGGACAAVVKADGTRSFGILAWQDSSASAAVIGSTNGIGMYMQYLGPLV